ncbi:hypothetical protein ACTQWG_00695 [Blautia sp. HCP3S3_H10_1]|uniref:hypothetical protein n=1 Tax=unclassified Blautia TaxID=2648079 RepID=UPI003F92991F
MSEIIFSKYSNERDRRFAIRTDILEENGRRWLQKTPLYPEGKEHIKNMLLWNQKLDALYKTAPFVSNKCEAGENFIKLEYLEEGNLAEYLDDLLEKGREEETKKVLMDYLEKVQKIHSQKPFSMTEDFKKVFGNVNLPENLTCADVTNIDLICDNVLLTSPYTILDYEWTFEFPVPCEFVLYRIIHYYIQTHSVRKALDEAALYEQFGITGEMQECFFQMEKGFQAYITGKHVPMREMYADMTPGVNYVSKTSSGAMQVFFGEQRGCYQEKNSVKRYMIAGNARCELELPVNCRFIRLDPGDVPCSVRLDEISFDGKPASLKGVETPDGAIFGYWAFLARLDPCIADIAVPEGAKTLTVKLEIYEENVDMLNHVRVLEHKNHSILQKVGNRAKKAVRRIKNASEGSKKKGN